jgi:hypothetical protein
MKMGWEDKYCLWWSSNCLTIWLINNVVTTSVPTNALLGMFSERIHERTHAWRVQTVILHQIENIEFKCGVFLDVPHWEIEPLSKWIVIHSVIRQIQVILRYLNNHQYLIIIYILLYRLRSSWLQLIGWENFERLSEICTFKLGVKEDWVLCHLL